MTDYVHTFLLEAHAWEARGYLWDEHAKRIEITGSAEIRHLENRWTNESRMRLLVEPSVEYRNAYQIEPLLDEQLVARWISDNPAIGRLRGTFALIGRSILSTYASEDGRYSGSEYFLQESATCYRVAGVMFRRQTRASSWEATLTAV